MTTHSKTARWLDLIAFLLAHRFPVTREELFGKVAGYLDDPVSADETARESARRKFERDKDELRVLGIGIETVTIPGGAHDQPQHGYRLHPRDIYLPYFELTSADRPGRSPYNGLATIPVSREELEILDRATRRVAQRVESPLGRAAASARRKLEFDLPLSVRDVERVLAHAVPPEGTRSLEVLQHAVMDRVAVRCTYYSIGRDAEEQRAIEPYGLFFNWGHWYCVARARDRDALRVFRIDRMRHAEAQAGDRFDVPDDFRVRSYVGRAPWELSRANPTSVRVRFAFPESRWIRAQGVGEHHGDDPDDGSAEFTFAVRDRGPFLRWLLTFRGHATVLEPDEIANELNALRKRVAEIYA